MAGGALQRGAYNLSHSHDPVLHHGDVARSAQFHGNSAMRVGRRPPW